MNNFDRLFGTGATPAFPAKTTSHQQKMGMAEQYAGLSIWQYYAAHAPAIPNWFMPEDESDDGIPSTHGLNEANKRQLGMVLGDLLDRNDASPEVRSFMVKFDEAKIGKPAAKRKALERRFFQWRIYYANEMARLGEDQK